MRIALAQINPTVGDLEGNRKLITRAIEAGKNAGADLVALPELAVTGYPPEDLLLRGNFIDDNLRSLDSLAPSTKGTAAIVGFVEREGDRLYNSAALFVDGELTSTHRKHHLPNYGVFDERRYFHPSDEVKLTKLAGVALGVVVCEDLWEEDGPHVDYARLGASVIVNINASPYHMGKGVLRRELLARRAKTHRVWIAYVNMVGGQDELVFDGQSLVVDPNGDLVARAAQFREELLIVDLDRSPAGTRQESGSIGAELTDEAEAYGALVLGVRDYLAKNDFDQALVGISGGIDSALTVAIAADAIGPSNVMGVFNPTDYTSRQSFDDARALAGNLGIDLMTLPIQDAFDAMRKALDPVLTTDVPDVTEENLQARIRGTLWMAISNKTGRIVLSTGNKSELSVGYATLYGDMAGGFAVLKDVPKTLVYRLARWRNTVEDVIPTEIIDRPPTAELRPGQLDTDSLPPYEILDPILEDYIERDLSITEIVGKGFDEKVVMKVARMVDRAEYKRRQAPPGVKITDRAFGRDRRLPITNRYRPSL